MGGFRGQLKEWFEDISEPIGRNSPASIGDVDPRGLKVHGTHGNANRDPSPFCELQGIVDQIDQHLLQLVRVRLNRFHGFRNTYFKLDVRVFPLTFELLYNLAHHRIQTHGTDIHLDSARFDFRKIQKRIDELKLTLRVQKYPVEKIEIARGQISLFVLQ